MIRAATPLVLVALLAGGCTVSMHAPYVALIDQRTFETAGPAPAAEAVKALPKLPLATIRMDDPDFDYTPELATAIDAAQARKPDVEFNVVIPVARGTVPSAQATKDAADVARAIAEQSIQPDHIHVGLIEDAGTPPREVLVYVR